MTEEVCCFEFIRKWIHDSLIAHGGGSNSQWQSAVVVFRMFMVSSWYSNILLHCIMKCLLVNGLHVCLEGKDHTLDTIVLFILVRWSGGGMGGGLSGIFPRIFWEIWHFLEISIGLWVVGSSSVQKWYECWSYGDTTTENFWHDLHEIQCIPSSLVNLYVRSPPLSNQNGQGAQNRNQGGVCRLNIHKGILTPFSYCPRAPWVTYAYAMTVWNLNKPFWFAGGRRI